MRLGYIGRYVRYLREQKKLHGYELAKMAGISQAKMYRLEQGQNVSVETIEQVLICLGADQLFQIENDVSRSK